MNTSRNISDKGEKMLSVGDQSDYGSPDRSSNRKSSLLKRLTNKIKVIRDTSEERKTFNWFSNTSQNSSPERIPVPKLALKE